MILLKSAIALDARPSLKAHGRAIGFARAVQAQAPGKMVCRTDLLLPSESIKEIYSMSAMFRRVSLFKTQRMLLLPAIVFAFLATFPAFVAAQAVAITVPENARANTYGDGWQCNQGYRKIDKSCNAIKMPGNAYLTNRGYGRGWACSYGYREQRENCVVFEVPKNAFLNSSGEEWECSRGFRKQGLSCAAIKVPLNGYLVNSLHGYGNGWECDRGYRAGNYACVQVKVPKNAHLDSTGSDWECNRPYQKRRDECVMK
jgi:hypothetical protein